MFNGSQLFIVIYAIISVTVGVCAIWYIWKAQRAEYKPLWILGCLFGFVGFSTNFSASGDLFFHFGIQIPFLMPQFLEGGNHLKVQFPVIAAVALAKFYGAERPPAD